MTQAVAEGSAAPPPRLAKIRIPGLSRGAGYAIGVTGVLTARSVIEPLLRPDVLVGAGTGVAEVVLGDAAHAYACRVVWHDAAKDLALLQVVDDQRRSWQTQLATSPPPVLASPWSERIEGATAAGFAVPALPADDSAMAWLLTPPDLVTASVQPGPRRDDLATAAVTGAVPAELGRHGLTGAAVFTHTPATLLTGVVTGRPHGRRTVRLEMQPLPDPDVDLAFATALQQVGADPIVYAMDGFVLRRVLHGRSLDAAGRPRTVSEVGTDWFGTHPARGREGGHFPYVDRPEAHALAAALDRAIAGKGPRLIVLRGPGAAGKSRLAAEALTRHEGLAGHLLVAPLAHRSLAELPARLRAAPTVAWLDPLDGFATTALDRVSLTQLLADNDRLILLGSVTADAPSATEAGRDAGWTLAADSLSGVRAAVADPDLATVVTVSDQPMWIRPDDEDPAVASALRAADEAGLGLGEYLACQRELIARYRELSDHARALVDLVVDWDRSGIAEPLPFETAARLWRRTVPAYLSRTGLAELADDEALHHAWQVAQRGAALPVESVAIPVRTTPLGYVSHPLLRRHAAGRAVATAVWDHLLTERRTDPAGRLSMGIRALEAETPQRALRAFETVLLHPAPPDGAVGTTSTGAPVPASAAAPTGTSVAASVAARRVEATARRGIARYFFQVERDRQAIAAYTDLIDSFHADPDPGVRDQVAQGLLGVGAAFERLGSHGQALSAYAELVEGFRSDKHPVIRSTVVAALLARASALAASDDVDGAAAAYREVVKRYRGDYSTAIGALVERARSALVEMGR